MNQYQMHGRLYRATLLSLLALVHEAFQSLAVSVEQSVAGYEDDITDIQTVLWPARN